MKTMFSSYYYYLYFLCLCLYVNVVAQGAENDKLLATNDSFDYQRRFTASPTEGPRWKPTAKAATGRQVSYSSSEDTISGIKNIEEEKNKKLLLINKDFIKEAKTKVFNKRDAKEEKITVETLSTFQANSSKSLADFFKDLNVSVVTPTSNISININRLLDADDKRLYLKQDEINLERKRQDNDIVEVTTEEELTAEDRYPNFVPTDNNIVNVGTKPNSFELGYVKILEKDFGFPEADKNAETHGQHGNKAGNTQEGPFPEYLVTLDDKFTTVKANQKIIYDPNKPNVTLQLEVLGESFEAFLDVLSEGIFMPNLQVTVHDKENTKNISLSTLKDYLNMYEGSLNSKNISYVCGSIVNSYFTGILMLENGTVWYVERPENSVNGKSTSVKETDISFHNCFLTNNSCHEVMLSGCKRNEKNKIICFEGRHEREEKSNSTKRLSLSNNTRSHHFSSDSLKNASCSLELVSDPSHFVTVHNQSIIHTLRELLTVILQANHVLNQVDFDGDGKPENLSLRIGHAAMYASYKDEGPESSESFMDQKLNTLLKHPQNSCLSLMFISSNPTDEEPISITYGGSICQGSLSDTRPPTNVAVVNTIGPKNRSRALLPMSLRVTETIGEMMGSLEKECENPLADPSSGNSWFSFFPNCSRESMTETLASRGSCLKTYHDHHTEKLKVGKHARNGSRCGNGIVDSGEECDCGSDCQKNYSCCVQSGMINECKFDRSKGHECEWIDPCCTMSCRIVPREWKKFCGNGDPSCGPNEAYCDGNSSTCPHNQTDSSASDGHRCGPGNLEQVGAGTCKNGRCDSTICRDAGLEDCHCPHKSRKTCKLCCKKKGKGHQCLPAESFGLKSNASNFFYRYPGLPCSTVNNEYCDSMGTCTSKLSGSGQADIFYSTLTGKGMSATALIAWTVLWRVMCLRLV